MERGFNSEDIITKVGRFSWRTIKKLGESEKINGISKKSYEKIVW